MDIIFIFILGAILLELELELEETMAGGFLKFVHIINGGRDDYVR